MTQLCQEVYHELAVWLSWLLVVEADCSHRNAHHCFKLFWSEKYRFVESQVSTTNSKEIFDNMWVFNQLRFIRKQSCTSCDNDIESFLEYLLELRMLLVLLEAEFNWIYEGGAGCLVKLLNHYRQKVHQVLLEQVWNDSDAVLHQSSGSLTDLLQRSKVPEQRLDEG